MLFIVAAYILIFIMDINTDIWIAVLMGSIGGIIIGLITEYYTAAKPIRDIAKSGETGAATVIIKGLSVGMQSVFLPVVYDLYYYFCS